MIVRVTWQNVTTEVLEGQPWNYREGSRLFTVTVTRDGLSGSVELDYQYLCKKFILTEQGSVLAFSQEWSQGCTIYAGFSVEYNILSKLLVVEVLKE